MSAVGGVAALASDIQRARQCLGTPTGICTSNAYGLFLHYHDRQPHGDAELIGFLRELASVGTANPSSASPEAKTKESTEAKP